VEELFILGESTEAVAYVYGPMEVGILGNCDGEDFDPWDFRKGACFQVRDRMSQNMAMCPNYGPKIG